MSTMAIQNPVFWKNTNNCAPIIVGDVDEPWVYEAASQTYKAGQLVYQDTSGDIAICTQSSSIHNGEILGIALQDGGNNGSAGVERTRVRVIRPGDIYCMNVHHTTVGSAVTSRTQLNDVFGLVLINPSTAALSTAATSHWCVDLLTTPEDGSNARAKVKVVGFPTYGQGIQSTIGDTYGLVLVQFLPFSFRSDLTGAAVRNLQWW